jgi:hypothetical protein
MVINANFAQAWTNLRSVATGVSSKWRCVSHGHVKPAIVLARGKEWLCCPHCLKPAIKGEAEKVESWTNKI